MGHRPSESGPRSHLTRYLEGLCSHQQGLYMKVNASLILGLAALSREREGAGLIIRKYGINNMALTEKRRANTP